MSTNMEFPINCITNSYVLHDFAEIAYIVCTHAIPATTDNAAPLNSPEQILRRLRNAEKQFRKASILVALDEDKLELFTFYKKVDVVRDQRVILSNFGLVCRLNSCIIARKSAARMLELLKPESNRVYQLFTSAILSSIRLSSRSTEPAISLGARRYLVPSCNTTSGIKVRSDRIQDWQLYRINLQVTPSGQVLLIIERTQTQSFLDLPRFCDDSGSDTDLVTESALVYLAPTGQLARYHGIRSKRLVDNDLGNGFERTDEFYALWTSSVLAWLDNREYYTDDSLTTSDWAQVEIPILEEDVDSNGNTDKVLVWKAALWPASLVFISPRSGGVNDTLRTAVLQSNPLEYVRDWANGTAEREASTYEAQAQHGHLNDLTDGETLFNDEVTFEDHDPAHLFGPPAFPASQMIYPTPPDGALTHPTPGLSAEGIAPTPIQSAHNPPSSANAFRDQEMSDAIEYRPSSTSHPNYDDDLFEEMPDETFESGGVSEEPNWDFFDQPGFGIRSNSVDESSGLDQSSHINSAAVERSFSGNLIQETASSPVDDPRLAKDSATDADEYALSLISDNIVDVIPKTNSSTPAHVHTAGTLSLPPNQLKPQIEDVKKKIEADSVFTGNKRRRSSRFEGVETASDLSHYDTRYQAHGKYFFDKVHGVGPKQQSTMTAKPPARPRSSGSSTSISSSNSKEENDAYINTQPIQFAQLPWTEYKSQTVKEGSPTVQAIGTASSKEHVLEILRMIESTTGEMTQTCEIQSTLASQKRPSYDEQTASMIAQILVDQISQSSLLREDPGMRLCGRSNLPEVSLSMDHSEAKASIANASLSDLTQLASHPASTSSRLRFTKVKTSFIRLRRADIDIKASVPVINFWEALSLQPLSGRKDVTAFCMHPASSNVSDSCATFLSRMSDMYSSCNLGSHSTGRLAGLTNDGLVAWPMSSGPGRNLKLICQRLGAAIAASITGGNVVMVYMISPSKELFWYREMCNAFTILFESLLKASHKQAVHVELVLQIVPVTFVASADTLEIPSQDMYRELALETYNRIPPDLEDKQLSFCGSAVVLDKPQLRDLNFDLSASSGSVSKSGDHLHLAYSYSFDQRWLTAAWTDEQGKVALTMSYCLKNSGGGTRHKREVLRDLWEISHDMMDKQKDRRRLVIARSGFYEDDELRDWLSFINQSNSERKAGARIMLLSIELEPSILLQLPSSSSRGVTGAGTGASANMSATPVSTPQTNVTSPDQGIAVTPTTVGHAPGGAPTPPDHYTEAAIDSENTLVDPLDEVWTAILAFGVNQSHDPLRNRPAAASGMLIKRTGDKDDARGLTAIGVHLVATSRLAQASPSTIEKENLLSDILEQFRRLAVLAVTRGCINKEIECVPWHIATAVKGARALGAVM